MTPSSGSESSRSLLAVFFVIKSAMPSFEAYPEIRLSGQPVPDHLNTLMHDCSGSECSFCAWRRDYPIELGWETIAQISLVVICYQQGYRPLKFSKPCTLQSLSCIEALLVEWIEIHGALNSQRAMPLNEVPWKINYCHPVRIITTP